MSDEKRQIRNSTAEFLIFTAQAGEESLEVRYEDETIWLTQKLIAQLFDVTVPTINEHLKNILASNELQEDSVIRKFRITAADGKSYDTQHYNLDAIISVGYRVNSVRATQFRQWATGILRDFAIHGHTAPELIKLRANSEKENMGLTHWENGPAGKILKADVSVAKNYLSKDELQSLGRLVNAYLELAEERAKRRIPMTMEDWAKRLDAFLEFDDREILQNADTISAQMAKEHATSEFEKFRIVQDRRFVSDFDREIQQKLKETGGDHD